MLLHRRFSYRRLCCARRGVKRTSQPFKCRLCVCWIPTETLCAPFARREKRNRLRVGLATTRNWTLSHLPGERWGLLVSLTSAGQIVPSGPPPYFVFIDRALRDEGTSYHYAPPSEFAEADPQLVMAAARAMFGKKLRAVVGASWTTDAPFRETEEAIEAARAKGILAVEITIAARVAGSARIPVLGVTPVAGRPGLRKS